MSKRKLSGKSSHQHERSAHSYDRQTGKRAPGRCILIVCEGAETEPNYFQVLRKYLKLSSVDVRIQNRGGAPISLIEEARRLEAQRKEEVRKGRTNIGRFDAVWCVFDVENPTQNTTFNEAVQKAENCKYALAISNPAFEFWYILHFEQTTRPFENGKEVKNYLQKYIPHYHEAMPVFDTLIGHTSMAMQHARDVMGRHPDNGQRFPNPSTQVHLLVEEMIEMSQSGRVYFYHS
jgi:hypothetical protein